jgi:transaldolase/glucose-6-phosphate isomerase
VTRRLETAERERWSIRLWDRDPTHLVPRSRDDRQNRATGSAGSRAPDSVRDQIDAVRALVAGAKADGLTTVRLLGMGGSSLCAEVLRRSAGLRPGALDVQVLDTTIPAAVRAAERDRERSLFLVASKSGSTIEVDALYRHFRAGLPADRFVAITDPGTPLETLARAEGFRAVFNNPGDIGGRFSALSLFGIVPAAFLGLDLDAFLAAAESMRALCGPDATCDQNPGVYLGTFLGEAERARRDKLTLLIDPSLSALGTWIEQLVAESTGKAGMGVLPITGEALAPAELYEDDRIFVHIGPDLPAVLGELIDAGQPVMSLRCKTPEDLAGQFFLWSMATAIAGAVLQVNPFDEPNVTEAKNLTRERLAHFSAHQRLPEDVSRAATTAWSPTPTRTCTASSATRTRSSRRTSPASPGRLRVHPGLPAADGGRGRALDRLRAGLGRGGRTATTIGYGPRYLHSTGQLHKGGPGTGVFLIITADDPVPLPIPGMDYDFATLALAQATGDFEALTRHGRRVVRLHLTSGISAGLESLNPLGRGRPRGRRRGLKKKTPPS